MSIRRTHHHLRLLLKACLCIGLAGPARAEPEAKRERLTGDWAGARTAMARRGVELIFSYALDAMANVSGGLSRGLVAVGAANLVLEADLAALCRWWGAHLRLYAIGNHTGGLSARVGDLQVVDNIEAPNAFRLFEAWIEQALGTPKLTLRGGLYDVNAEFDVIPPAALFIHSSPGMGAAFGNSGSNGPSSFPVTSLAARLEARPTEMLYLRAVVAEGVPGDPDQPGRTRIQPRSGEGALVAAEIGVYRLPGPELQRRDRSFREPYIHQHNLGEGWFGKYAVGAWAYTGDVTPMWKVGGDVETRRSSYGAYLLAVQRVVSEPAAPAQGLAAYLRPGVADRRISLFDGYLGAGLVYRGAFPGRDDDRLGLALSAAHFGPAYRADLASTGAGVAPWEVALELTYRAAVLGWLSLQPDLQWVLHPGGRAELAPAWVVGLRTAVQL